jgi:hypothetical protein
MFVSPFVRLMRHLKPQKSACRAYLTTQTNVGFILRIFWLRLIKERLMEKHRVCRSLRTSWLRLIHGFVMHVSRMTLRFSNAWRRMYISWLIKGTESLKRNASLDASILFWSCGVVDTPIFLKGLIKKYRWYWYQRCQRPKNHESKVKQTQKKNLMKRFRRNTHASCSRYFLCLSIQSFSAWRP